MPCGCGSGRPESECLIHVPSPPPLYIPGHLTIPGRVYRWRNVARDGLGVMNDINDSLHALETRFGEILPDFRNCAELFVGSDYSGTRVDKKAKYEFLSFVIFPYHEAKAWHERRLEVRELHLEQRSMSLKAMNDGKRRRGLQPFLAAAGTIPGALITVAVSKEHKSLFDTERIDMRAPELKAYSHWTRDTFERMLRVTHMLAFFLAGLSDDVSSFVWFSDDDDIAANMNRRRELGEIWRAAITHLVPQKVEKLMVGTKADDEPTHSLADILAVPDLVCGAWCQLLARMSASDFISGASAVTSTLETLSTPALQVLQWFAAPGEPLKRVLCIIDQPIGDRGAGYMCSIPPALDAFRDLVENTLGARSAG